MGLPFLACCEVDHLCEGGEVWESEVVVKMVMRLSGEDRKFLAALGSGGKERLTSVMMSRFSLTQFIKSHALLIVHVPSSFSTLHYRRLIAFQRRERLLQDPGRILTLLQTISRNIDIYHGFDQCR